MHSTNDELQILARRMGEDNMSSRAELEAKLARLLHLVLRTGLASPSLLQWVRLTLPEVPSPLPSDGSADAEWAALPLARLLCLQLRHDMRAQRDTMVKRQTIGLPAK